MLEYPDEVIDRLQLLWGEGFMSPGGPEEVKRIVRGIELDGKRVLDIGCGSGGPAAVLAGELGARVTGLDVEAPVLKRAQAHAEAAGLTGRLDFVLAAPGPLPFADASFDLVFSKDALIHVPDKAAIYSEILRVLRPGGRFVASDWLAGEGAENDPEFRRFVAAEGGMSFTMATAAATAGAMRQAGFVEVETADRNAWYAECARRELDALLGELRPVAVARMGSERFETWIVRRRLIAAIANSGSLRPTDLRGRRPE
jgi:phosphoethanolamine N-methyltransferase